LHQRLRLSQLPEAKPDAEKASLTVKTFALLVSALMAFAVTNLPAAETIPPKPAGYFNDYAGVVSKEAALRFNEQLAQFERETSNQLVVAVFRKMESNSSIEDYGQRVAQAWGVGKKEVSKGNGVVMLVFIDDRKISIQAGYGLEGALPDAVAFDIRTRHINPLFRNGEYERGLGEGIDLICKAIRGEYTGDGKTNAEKASKSSGRPIFFLVIFVIVLLLSIRSSRRRRGYGYSSFGGPFLGGWSGGSGGGWSSGSSGGGFSGFSGGGGSFGGGGSSGSW
jgi:uncharacterized protein